MIIGFIERSSVEVHASFNGVAITILYDAFHERDDFWDIFRDTREGIRVSNSQPPHVFEEFGFPVCSRRPEYAVICDRRTMLTSAVRTSTIKHVGESYLFVQRDGEDIFRFIDKLQRELGACLSIFK